MRQGSADQHLKLRCSWITKSSEEACISFHDKSGGVPVFHDSQLFELLMLSGMLIDHTWTEILRRRELYREAFAKFDHNVVAQMNEKDIAKIISNKNLSLSKSRVRCIINNAECIQKKEYVSIDIPYAVAVSRNKMRGKHEVVEEFGSFSGYIWSHVNHKPIINNHIKHPRRRSISFKTPKSQAISKDLVRRGFRLVSPVIAYSFMQAAGLAIDHEIRCFRFSECVDVAKRYWGLTSLGL